LGGLFLDWAVGVVVVYAALFGAGHALLGSGLVALVFLAVALAGIFFLLRRTGKVSNSPSSV
jgi:high-affinity Fe2+/Pb2+ permease